MSSVSLETHSPIEGSPSKISTRHIVFWYVIAGHADIQQVACAETRSGLHIEGLDGRCTENSGGIVSAIFLTGEKPATNAMSDTN